VIRLVDYPGHKTLFAKLLGLLLPTTWNGSGSGSGSSSGNIRALLVVDSTKSVGEAAWILYKILTHGKFVQEWNDKTTTTTTTNRKKSNDKGGLQIMVVCNKSDESNAKNWRRIKIQLRNELEALRKVSTCCVVSAAAAAAADHDEEEFLLTGKSIDLDDLSKNGVKGVKLSFMSYSAKTGNGWKDLCDFVMSGTLPHVDSGRILDRRK
jgi:signal recognition particle receptor subunit beta